MQSPYGNPTIPASRPSQRVEDARSSRRHNPIGPSRTRLVNRHNPYATTVPKQDSTGSILKGQRRNRREARPRPPTKQVSIHPNQHIRGCLISNRQCPVIDADVAMASGTLEGSSQDISYLQPPESTPAPTSTLPEVQPNHPPAVCTEHPPFELSQCASTSTIPSPPHTPRLVARDPSLDEVRSVRSKSSAIAHVSLTVRLVLVPSIRRRLRIESRECCYCSPDSSRAHHIFGSLIRSI